MDGIKRYSEIKKITDMKKIDFSRVPVFKDIAKTQKSTENIQEAFANVIYNNGAGLAAHALALKIYNAKGAEEYDDSECELIRQYSQICNPYFIDAIDELLKDKKEE